MRTAIVAMLLAVIGGGVWYFVQPTCDVPVQMDALVKMLDEVKRSNAGVLASKEKETQLQMVLEVARVAEAEAKMSGNPAKQRELVKLTRQRETELQRQSELTKRREAWAQKRADVVKRWQDEIARAPETKERCRPANAVKVAAVREAALKDIAKMSAAEDAAEREVALLFAAIRDAEARAAEEAAPAKEEGPLPLACGPQSWAKPAGKVELANAAPRAGCGPTATKRAAPQP